ncbi:unnamed protein product [Amoebophrya sp. A120]|nr:unnamed protein product [Amoebophrya sp. A120]|eukprot:GSA120T00012004001.1
MAPARTPPSLYISTNPSSSSLEHEAMSSSRAIEAAQQHAASSSSSASSFLQGVLTVSTQTCRRCFDRRRQADYFAQCNNFSVGKENCNHGPLCKDCVEALGKYVLPACPICCAQVSGWASLSDGVLHRGADRIAFLIRKAVAACSIAIDANARNLQVQKSWSSTTPGGTAKSGTTSSCATTTSEQEASSVAPVSAAGGTTGTRTSTSSVDAGGAQPVALSPLRSNTRPGTTSWKSHNKKEFSWGVQVDPKSIKLKEKNGFLVVTAKIPCESVV